MKILTIATDNLLCINFDQAQQRIITLYDFAGNCVHKSTVINETEARIQLNTTSSEPYILQVNGLFQKVYMN